MRGAIQEGLRNRRALNLERLPAEAEVLDIVLREIRVKKSSNPNEDANLNRLRLCGERRLVNVTSFPLSLLPGPMRTSNPSPSNTSRGPRAFRASGMARSPRGAPPHVRLCRAYLKKKRLAPLIDKTDDKLCALAPYSWTPISRRPSTQRDALSRVAPMMAGGRGTIALYVFTQYAHGMHSGLTIVK